MSGTTIKFTEGKLDAIKPPAQRDKDTSSTKVYYFDTECSALSLRVSSSGAKSFVAYIWDRERRRTDRTTIGRYSKGGFRTVEFDKDPLAFAREKGSNVPLTIDMARKLALAVVGSTADLKEQKRRSSAELTLKELFEEYLERHAKKSRKTWRDMQAVFDRHLAQWSTRPISSITHSEVDALHGRLGKDSGEYMANRVLQLLRAMYNKGISWKLFDKDNPAAGITLFNEKPRDRFLSSEEAARLWKVLSAEKPGDVKDFIMLAMLTGARKNNVLSMRWEEIDEARKLWTIPETKNGERLDVAITDAELAILRARRAMQKKKGYAGPWVFPSKSATGHLMDPKRQWIRIRDEAGLGDVTIHDLRRSLAASMANSNINLALVKAVMGHKDMKTTVKVYARTGKDAERDARQLATQSWLSKVDTADTVVELKPTTQKRKRANKDKK